MTLFDEYMSRTDEFVKELPKEIADEIYNDVKRQENDKNFRASDISTERLCDYIALNFFPEHIPLSQCMQAFTNRLPALATNEFFELCGFLVSRKKFFDGYGFTASLAVLSLLKRYDIEAVLKRFKKLGCIELLELQNMMEYFVHYIQKNK